MIGKEAYFSHECFTEILKTQDVDDKLDEIYCFINRCFKYKKPENVEKIFNRYVMGELELDNVELCALFMATLGLSELLPSRAEAFKKAVLNNGSKDTFKGLDK